MALPDIKGWFHLTPVPAIEGDPHPLRKKSYSLNNNEVIITQGETEVPLYVHRGRGLRRGTIIVELDTDYKGKEASTVRLDQIEVGFGTFSRPNNNGVIVKGPILIERGLASDEDKIKLGRGATLKEFITKMPADFRNRRMTRGL